MQVSSQAVPALEHLFQAMQTVGLHPVLVSGYRSTAAQKQLYEKTQLKRSYVTIIELN